MLKKIHHKKNEKQEVEFFEDKECTEPALNIIPVNANFYIETTDIGIILRALQCDPNLNLYIPYLPEEVSFNFSPNIRNIAKQHNSQVKTLNDITPNLSKYIPEDNILMFIGNIEELCKFNKIKTKYTTHHAWFCNEENKWIIPEPKQSNKLTIFLHHGTQSETEKAMEVSKYLWENFGIKPNLCALHWFYKNEDYDVISFLLYNKIFNKIITTNSTGILKPEDSNEYLQVIDCFDIFQDHLSNI